MSDVPAFKTHDQQTLRNQQKEDTPSLARYSLDDGHWFDISRSETWVGKCQDAPNQGTQDTREDLYRTRKGNWVLRIRELGSDKETWTRIDNSNPIKVMGELQEQDGAAWKWMVKNGHYTSIPLHILKQLEV